MAINTLSANSVARPEEMTLTPCKDRQLRESQGRRRVDTMQGQGVETTPEGSGEAAPVQG